MIFVDSNVIIDLIDDGQDRSGWTREIFGALGEIDLVTNAVVLAEVSRAFSTAGDALLFLRGLGVTLMPIDPDAAFLAGKAYARYRRSGGPRQSILADFMIGAHAASLGAVLITRDKARFATYFPDLTLITPESTDD